MSTEKGRKRLKNQPVLHDELKKKRGVWITDTAWGMLQETAVRNQTSCSEYLEMLIRRECG
ncbi:hypothetical protein [Microseira wollei]|uniref:CopG domain protein DNA-binding domain protein n=1 Tax=Microseira wollei NIES-4236 TaxID=2530354 RepID=A0AAV3XD15_9CYAN|nr:hypothetical protein [Microseira wollei]GET40234.1 hypothetical protein MiSe_50430 [Microseira wollei NIES-4236]